MTVPPRCVNLELSIEVSYGGGILQHSAPPHYHRGSVLSNGNSPPPPLLISERLKRKDHFDVAFDRLCTLFYALLPQASEASTNGHNAHAQRIKLLLKHPGATTLSIFALPPSNFRRRAQRCIKVFIGGNSYDMTFLMEDCVSLISPSYRTKSALLLNFPSTRHTRNGSFNQYFLLESKLTGRMHGMQVHDGVQVARAS
jgi:hypothetical protein